MELYFLDADFSVLCGPCDSFTSAVFRERFFSVGSFEIHLPLSEWSLIRDAVYVRTGYEGGECLCGRIGYSSLSVGSTSFVGSTRTGECEVGGEMLECLLADRVLPGVGNVSGKLGESALGVISGNLRGSPIVIETVSETSPEGSDETSEEASDESGEAFAEAAAVSALDGEAALSWDFDNAASWLYKVLSPVGASFRIRLTGAKVPTLTLSLGADHSSDTVLSTSYGNIASLELERSRSKMKNRAYVTGSDGTSVTLGAEEGSGARETAVKARDISPSEYETNDEYIAALTQRGREELAKLTESEKVSAESAPSLDIPLALGDICSVSDRESGINGAMRVIGIDTVAENGRMRHYPVLGSVK